MNEIEVLEILQDSIESTETAAVIENIPGTERKVLHAEYPGSGKDNRNMIVSVMFVPEMIPQNDKTLDCMIMVDIAENIPDDVYPILKQGLSVLNYITTRGSFVMTPDCTGILYRNTVNFVKTDENEKVAATILYQIGSALAITAIWIDSLDAVINGTMSFEQLIDKIYEHVGA